MVSRVFQLTCVVVAALALCSGTDAYGPTYVTYTTQSSPITIVNPADRVSASQLFQREVTISTASRKLAPYIMFEANLPGRVFFSYSDKTPTDDTTFGKIKISGSSDGAVSFVKVDETTEGSTLLQLRTESEGHNVTSADSVLIEVEVYKKNSVLSVHSAGICDTVVLTDVLYTPSANGSYEEDNYNRTELWTGYGKFFVSDPNLKMGAFDIDVISESNYTVQVEVGQMNADRPGLEYWDPLTVDCTDRCNIVLLAEKISPLTVIYAEEGYKANSSLCIGSKAEVNVTRQIGSDLLNGAGTQKSSWKILPSGGTCTKLPLPDRVPGLIGDFGYAPAASKNTAMVPGGSSGAISNGNLAAVLGGFAAVILATLM